VRVVLCVWLAVGAVSAAAGHQAVAPTPQDAMAQQDRGDWRGAEKTWRDLTAASPGDYRYWTSLGICLAHEGGLDEAIGAYQKSLAINPKLPQTQFNLGIAYFKQGRFEKAIPALKAGAAGMPDTAQADLLLGMALYGTNQYREAAGYLSRARRAQPDNSELGLVLARSYLLSADYEKAREEFEALLRQDPDSTPVHMLLGEAYDALGQSGNAVREFELAAKKGNVPDAHFALGFLFWRDKRYEEAGREFQKELALDPRHFQALAYLGDIRLKQGDDAGAEKLLKESLAAKDGLWITHYDLGLLASEQKQYATAIAQLQSAEKLDPKRADTHYRLAQIYKQTGNADAAKEELRTVSQLHQRYNQDLIVKVTGSAEKPSAH
jgi:tetratricopeptide (TPR) repeat protein